VSRKNEKVGFVKGFDLSFGGFFSLFFLEDLNISKFASEIS